jgi:hypothetical protein
VQAVPRITHNVRLSLGYFKPSHSGLVYLLFIIERKYVELECENGLIG